MTLSELSVKRPVTFFILFIGIVGIGVVALSHLSPELLPDFTFPIVGVFTSYPDVGPQEIENLVTRPIEGMVSTVTNIKEISSITREGASIIIVRFNWGTNMDVAALDVREKVDMIQKFLPSDVEKPMIFKFDPSMMPVIMLRISGRKNEVELRKIAQDKIKPLIERIEGVGYSEVMGGEEREIRVELNRLQMEARGLTIDHVVSALRAASVNLSGGSIERGNKEYTVRGLGEFKTVKEIEKVSIPGSRGIYYLRDIAEVKDTFKEKTSTTLINGEPGVVIMVQKASGYNTVRVCRGVKKEIARIEKTLPGISIGTMMDQSEFIERSLREITSTLIQGSILAILVLFFFLYRFRATGIIALAIPISVIGTFIVMYLSGITLNMMSMGGLAIAAGMLVDNAIVVLENSFRRWEKGEDWKSASIGGAEEVTAAIMGSTLTTVAVFLPMVFVTGIIGIFSRDMALTVTLSLLVSLFMALTLVPLLCSQTFKIEVKSPAEKVRNKFQKWWEEKVLFNYKKYLNYCLNHRWTVIVVMLAIFIISLSFLYPFHFVGMEFIPRIDEGEISIRVELPVGTKLEETENTVKKIEEIVRREVPEAKVIQSSIGGAGMASIIGISGGSYRANVNIELLDLKKRKRSQWEIERILRHSLSQIPGAKISIGGGGMIGGGTMGGGGAGMRMGLIAGAPISVEIYGYDMDKAKQVAEEVKKIIAEIPGTAEINISMEEVKPEVQLQVDREKASSWGLPPALVINTMRSYIYGVTATRFRESGEEYDIVVRLREEDRKNIEDLSSLPISLPAGGIIHFGDVCSVHPALGPVRIERKMQERMVSVEADYEGKDLNKVTNDIENKIKNLTLPENFFIKIGGEAKEMRESFMLLGYALIGALFLVYAVMAATFESLLDPFVIMFTFPLAIIGVVWILFFTGNTFNALSFVGLIMLVGIAVNNGIVMVDFIKRLREKGLALRDAVIQGAAIRLRPILMTSLTTIFGLLPMAMGMGEGAEIRIPIAQSVLGGMTVTTFLTLFFIPTLYTVIEERLLKRKQRKTNNP